MDTIIAIVKWMFQDNSLRDHLNTTINIIGTKKKFMEKLPLELTEEHIKKSYKPHKIKGYKNDLKKKNLLYQATAFVTTSAIKFHNRTDPDTYGIAISLRNRNSVIGGFCEPGERVM